MSGPNSNMNILFVGDFQHENLESDIDEITFREAVIVKGFQIVPSGTNPHPDTLPNFKSVTQTEKFTLELFARDLNNPQKTYFDRLTPKFEAQGGVTFNTQEEIITNHLILRGVYSALSICLYGSVVPRPQLSEHIIGALEKGASADSAPEPINSNATWEMEKCPSPPNSSLADPWELTFSWTQAPGLGEVPSNLLWAEEKVDPYSAGFYMNTSGIRQLSSLAYYLAEKPLSTLKPADQYEMVLNAAAALKQAMQVNGGESEEEAQLAPCTDCLPSWLGDTVVKLALDGCDVLTEPLDPKISDQAFHDRMRVAQASFHLVQVVLVNGILAYAFAQSGGLETLYKVVSQQMTPPKAKVQLLKALWNGAQHTTVLAHFLATHQVQVPADSESEQQTQSVCGYEVVLSLATSGHPQPKAVMDLCRALLRRAALFQRLNTAVQLAFRLVSGYSHLLEAAVPDEWPEVVAAVFNRHPIQTQPNPYPTNPKETALQFSQFAEALDELYESLAIEMEEEGKTTTANYTSAYPEGHLGRMVCVPPLCSAPLRRLLAENGFLELLAVGAILALHAGDTKCVVYKSLSRLAVSVVGTKGGDLLLSSQPRIVTAMARILDGTPSLGTPEGLWTSGLGQPLESPVHRFCSAPALARLVSQTVCALGLVEGVYASVAALQAYKAAPPPLPAGSQEPSPQHLLLDALVRALHGVSAGLSLTASGQATAVQVVAAHALPSLFDLLKDDSTSLPNVDETQDAGVRETVGFIHQSALHLLLDTIDSNSQAANTAIITNWENIKKALDWAIADPKRTGVALHIRATAAVNYMDPLCQTLPDGVLGLINLLQEMSKDLSVIDKGEGKKDEDNIVKKEEDTSKDEEIKKPLTVRFLPALALVLRALYTIASDEVAHHQICSSETVSTLVAIVSRCSKVFYPDLRFARSDDEGMLDEITKGEWPWFTKSSLKMATLSHHGEVLKCLIPCLQLLKLVLQKMSRSGVRNYWDDDLYESLMDSRCSLAFLPGVHVLNKSMGLDNLSFGLTEFGHLANEANLQISSIIALWLPPSSWAPTNNVLSKISEKLTTSPFYLAGGIGLLTDLLPDRPSREPTDEGTSVARQWSMALGQDILQQLEDNPEDSEDSQSTTKVHPQWFSKFAKDNITEIISNTLPWTLVSITQTSSPELHTAALELVQRVVGFGAHSASTMVLVSLLALYRSLQTIIKKNYSKSAKRVVQGDSKQAPVWESIERILIIVRHIGGLELGRKALLKNQAISALVACLGLGKWEVCVAALGALEAVGGVELMGSSVPIKGRMHLGATVQAKRLTKAVLTTVTTNSKVEVVLAGCRLLCGLLQSKGSAATTLAVETPLKRGLCRPLCPPTTGGEEPGDGAEKAEEGQVPVWILQKVVVRVTTQLEKEGQQVAGYLEEFPLQHAAAALEAARAAAWVLQLILMVAALGDTDHLNGLMESLRNPVMSLTAGASALKETCESVSEDLCRNLAEVDVTSTSSSHGVFNSELPFSLLLSRLKKFLSLVVSLCDQLLRDTSTAAMENLAPAPFFQISREYIEPLMVLDTRYEAEKMFKYTTSVLRLEQIEIKIQEKKEKQKNLANKRTKLERPPPPLPLIGIDRFRSRKSTSSRGPSKHVDDYMKDDSMAPLAGAVPAVVAQKEKK